MIQNPQRIPPLLAGLIFGVMFLGSCSKPKADASYKVAPQDSAACTDGVKKFLGQSAEVMRCGRAAGTETLEAVGSVRIKSMRATADGWPVSQLAVVRLDSGRWRSVLSASKDWVRNDAGYVGMDFIDDSYKIFGYRAAVEDHKGDGKPGLLVSLSYLLPSGESEGIPIWIAWNPKAKKYQEVVNSEGPFEFKSEIPQPPHRSTGRPRISQ